MELQLQVYLIVGIGSFFIAALILTSSLLVYYLSKLYKKISEERNENSYLSKYDVGISNNAVNLDDELSRRYTMHTPEPESIEITKFDDRSAQRKPNNKDSSKINNVGKNSRGSVIDVSEEFNWRTEASSKYNTNITLQQREENPTNIHESRTAFNDRTY